MCEPHDKTEECKSREIGHVPPGVAAGCDGLEMEDAAYSNSILVVLHISVRSLSHPPGVCDFLSLHVSFSESYYSIARGIRQALEAGVLAEERELHRADRSVALFADNHFGHTFVGGLRVVDFVAIDEQDQICVLFDRT